MLHDFEEYLKEKMTNEKTIRGYVKDVESFFHYMDSNDLKIGGIKEVHIKRFNLELAEQHYSNHTIARKNSALRLFFRYVRKQGIITQNPIEDIRQPTLQQRETPLSIEEVQLMEDTMQSSRDRLLLRLLFHEGAKISEVVSCKIGDYNRAQGILYLHKRAVTVSEESKKLIEQMIGDDTTYLISGLKNKPLSESGVYFILKNYFKAINRPDLRPIDLVKSKNKS